MAELASRAHVGIVLGRSTTEADGIRDYTHLLMGALRGTAVDAELFEWADGAPHDPHGRSGGKDAVAELAAMDVLVLQYNPFSFGRWGFARGLPRFLARLRRKRRRPRIAVMFHETSLTCAAPRGRSWEVGSARSSWRCRPRPTSSCVRSSAGQSGFAGRRSAAPVHHLPVASNLPDAPAHRDQARRQLRADADTLVLSCIGLRHPGRLQERVLAAAVHLARNVCLRSTGFLCRERTGQTRRCQPRVPGTLYGRRVDASRFGDGGTPARRGSCRGSKPPYRRLLESPGLVLVKLGLSDGSARTVTSLAQDPERLARLGAAGRGLYGRHFDWPVLARQLRAHLDV